MKLVIIILFITIYLCLISTYLGQYLSEESDLKLCLWVKNFIIKTLWVILHTHSRSQTQSPKREGLLGHVSNVPIVK